jgi:hypothetical protein
MRKLDLVHQTRLKRQQRKIFVTQLLEQLRPFPAYNAVPDPRIFLRLSTAVIWPALGLLLFLGLFLLLY